jgi:hypothetical protein
MAVEPVNIHRCRGLAAFYKLEELWGFYLDAGTVGPDVGFGKTAHGSVGESFSRIDICCSLSTIRIILNEARRFLSSATAPGYMGIP